MILVRVLGIVMSSSSLFALDDTSAPRPGPAAAIPVIGLIGAIGGGKSTVAAMLLDRGAAVIDADAVGHRVLDLPAIRARLRDRFGLEVIGEDGRVDRGVLGRIVFADEGARRDLEAIVHPEMRRDFERTIAEQGAGGRVLAVILDAAILLEAGWDVLCDRIVFVDAPWETRLERVSRNRGWTADMLRAREAAQWPLADKRARADRILTNDRGRAELERAVDHLLQDVAAPTAPRK
ncbi:dephospho-CoA kinase [Aquisphaera insulae]|uniref:dephospho-CoA kinase n=1 Tax=Aquisphaera insulae TaxID=2712864 RepID=UPI0013EABFFF|nr:dephospho-CoA kinase [Aquisphaera insulae]